MADKLLHELLDAGQNLLGALTPAAIGAAVGQAWEKGLSWSQRLIQWAVGICVSYYVTRAIAALWSGMDPFMVQAISFVVAMLAFKATPRFLENATAIIAGLPQELRDRFLPKKDG